MKFVANLFAISALMLIIFVISIIAFLMPIISDLPSSKTLINYKPNLASKILAEDGTLLTEYADKYRLFVPIDSIPKKIINTFIATEDQNFYHHPGFDIIGIIRAIVKNLRSFHSGKRPNGASTITQQVAKNFLVGSKVTIARKIREIIIAMRIEKELGKDKIMELYLNQIFLGNNSYGIAAASLKYFSKSIEELNIQEMALIAALAKGPSYYNPFKNPKRTIERRNYVLKRMYEEQYINYNEFLLAKASPLNLHKQNNHFAFPEARYFVAEVRRSIESNYGKKELFKEGITVKTTVDLKIQQIAQRELSEWLSKLDREKGWRGSTKTIDTHLSSKDIIKKLLKNNVVLQDKPLWHLAIVDDVLKNKVNIRVLKNYKNLNSKNKSPILQKASLNINSMKWAFVISKDHPNKDLAGKKTTQISNILKTGDIIYVASPSVLSNHYVLRQLPKLNGALVAMDPTTGRVKALVGGFSFDLSQFNRATQAKRQPGSSIKPIVYAAALDNGYKPTTLILDAPLNIKSGNKYWNPSNYSKRFYGYSTLREGLERSQNAMTVRLAREISIPLIAEYARKFGVYKNMPHILSMVLGAGETSLLSLTSAYAIIDNGGKRVFPSLIDKMQDRLGIDLYKHDSRFCSGCNVNPENQYKAKIPIVEDNSEQVLDPMTAAQLTSILEGVIKSGTGRHAGNLGRPVAGKTGTTNNNRDAWFIGYTPDIVVGLYIGYDIPKSIGKHASGGKTAAPLFVNFVKKALAGIPAHPFEVPAGMTAYQIDKTTGKIASFDSSKKNIITELFKPGSKPENNSIIGEISDTETDSSIDFNSIDENLFEESDSKKDISSGTSGLY